MSDRTQLPPGTWNLPPGVTLRDIEGAQECPHQHPDGADAFVCISYEIDPNNDGRDMAIFRCSLCGENQEKEIRQ